MLDGKPFYFGGTNSYSLFYSSHDQIDAFFAECVSLHVTVVRTWLYADGKSFPGGDAKDANGNQIWFIEKSSNGDLVFNDSPATGLGRFDYVLTSAKAHGVKLIVTLSNNWQNFGGVDWYVDRFGRKNLLQQQDQSNSTEQQQQTAGGSNPTDDVFTSFHSEFFESPFIKRLFKSYVSHVLNRVNSLTQVAYKDESAILAVELMNEPRCAGTNTDNKFPQDPTCSAALITRWVDEMSTYIKTIDSKHLVSIGDEGFFNRGPTAYPGAYGNVYDGSSGVDFAANAALPNIDLVGFHSYFNQWMPTGAKDSNFLANTLQWIQDHAPSTLSKPVFLGEYGVDDLAVRDASFPAIQQKLLDLGFVGGLTWILSSATPCQKDGDYGICLADATKLMSRFDKEMRDKTV